MTQKYPGGGQVLSPGTVIITAAGEVRDIRKTVSPVIVPDTETTLIYIDVSKCKYSLGGSSFAQVLRKIGAETPTVYDSNYFIEVFNTVQQLIMENKILAGHDISGGGMITTLLEMCFAMNNFGMKISLDTVPEKDLVKILFSENPGIIIQIRNNDNTPEILKSKNINYYEFGRPSAKRTLRITKDDTELRFDIDLYRDIWYRTSLLFDKKQCGEKLALERFRNYKTQPLHYRLNHYFTGKASQFNINLQRREKTGIRAAIIREKGINGDREMAYSLYLAGFDVKDVHMIDLISGRENLEDIYFIVFTGGFSNSDVLGSAKGWAGSFLFNPKANKVLIIFINAMIP